MELRFHGDESYDGKGFVFAGWLGAQEEWDRLDRQWEKRLDFERRMGRPLSRYHADDCEARKGEYSGWTDDQRLTHVKKLVAIIRRRALAVVAVGVDLDALIEVFPGDKKDLIAAAYDLSVRQAMIMMARGVKRALRPETSIAFFHDRSRYNGVVRRAFDNFKCDTRWANGYLFADCMPQSWEHCVALQPADMLAFDTRRMLYARLRYNSITMRRSLRELVGDGRPIMARYFDMATLRRLKQIHSDQRHEVGVTSEGA